MPIKKVDKDSNMYQGWITHTKGFLAGECPHHCSYCYVQAMAKRFGLERYKGPVRLVESEFEGKPFGLGRERIIFIEHTNDLFAAGVPDGIIRRVLTLCHQYDHTYVFQTKNPARYLEMLQYLPPKFILGTTIESNRTFPDVMRDAPEPEARRVAMVQLRTQLPREKLFVTIEPILDFQPVPFVAGLAKIRPDFINIGADSKGRGLPEPSGDKVRELLARLKEEGIEVRQKSNLGRLLK
jgi:hypothetical protein